MHKRHKVFNFELRKIQCIELNCNPSVPLVPSLCIRGHFKNKPDPLFPGAIIPGLTRNPVT